MTLPLLLLQYRHHVRWLQRALQEFHRCAYHHGCHSVEMMKSPCAAHWSETSKMNVTLARSNLMICQTIHLNLRRCLMPFRISKESSICLQLDLFMDVLGPWWPCLACYSSVELKTRYRDNSSSKHDLSKCIQAHIRSKEIQFESLTYFWLSSSWHSNLVQKTNLTILLMHWHQPITKR